MQPAGSQVGRCEERNREAVAPSSPTLPQATLGNQEMMIWATL